ncbi:hypothetical protein PRIPAC_97506 [Pristionchus pacificus]|uniref:Uncharacterized protein n=1 Tax=Pristionchus pacificus TaxID=54126 RepID=A0A2A6CUS5_PRIPA|nr:hypothetical protein PRIPAC_97506 [Pristionchus pacificus]|eukprot:PDM81850.1 hypothetical protein PRIPAC_34004 [Pristionchus pacificus]
MPTSSNNRPSIRPITAYDELKLEVQLDEIHIELERAQAMRKREVHMKIDDPILAELIINMKKHMRSDFSTFPWSGLIHPRSEKLLRKIASLTLVVELIVESDTVEKENEGIFGRIAKHLESVVKTIRNFF